MTSYPKPRADTIVSEKTIKYGGKSLRLLIHESPDTFTLYIGGHTMFCIDALIYKEDSPFSRIINIHQGYLSHIYYNQLCSLEHNFARGIDTNNILKLACSYIAKHFPHIEGLVFNDTSMRACNNGSYVNLYEMSYIRLGHTWYEEHFNATVHPKYKETLSRHEAAFQGLKKDISWQMMKSYITAPLPMEEDELEKLYNSAASWQDFFGPLSDSIKIDKFCIFVSDWIHGFMMSLFKLELSSIQYIMPVQGNTIEYTESAYSRGGKRFTRKQLRMRPRNET